MNAGANFVANFPGVPAFSGSAGGALGFDSGQTSESRPTSWSQGPREWTPGFSDWLGDRFIDFDLESATSLERLQFRREFSDSAVFEAELCERVELLHALHHPSLSAVRSVVRVPGKGLVLESEHTAGRRLSELLPEELGPTLSLDLVRQLTPVLVVLKNAGERVAHCAIGAERVVVTRDGRLVLVEHVLGSALAAMQIHPSKWRTLYGLPADRGVVALDDRGDLIQLGFLALSVLLGRRLNPLDYPVSIDALVGESAQMASGHTAEAAWLRRWIERALQVGPDPFTSAQEAFDTVGELSDAGLLQPVRVTRPLRSVPMPASVSPAPVTTAPVPSPAAATVAKGVTAPTAVPATTRSDDRGVDIRPKTSPRPAPPRPAVTAAPVATAPSAPAPVATARVASVPAAVTSPTAGPREEAPAARRRTDGASKPVLTAELPEGSKPWLTRALAALAVAEAFVIAGLLVTRPSAAAVVGAGRPPAAPAIQSADTLPPVVRLPPIDRTAASVPKPAAAPAIDTTQPQTPPANPADKPAAPGAQLFGGLRVTAPVLLQVLEDGKLLGSTSGPIVLGEGKHALDLVNDTLEFRSHATTAVKAGQMTAIAIPVPNGHLSINAVPWADVLIDGKAVGQTPLANLSVAIGEHEIVFRNPSFSEQRQTAVVKAESPVRVSMTFPK